MRLEEHLSQKIIGQRLGQSTSTVSRIERGLKTLTADEIVDYLNKSNLDIKKYRSFRSSMSIINNYKAEDKLNVVEEPVLSIESKSVIIKLLKGYFEDKPLKEVYLFGSTARNEHTSNSDIDLYLYFRKDYPVSIFDLGKMQVEINELTGKEIDLILAGSEHEFVKDSLHQDKIMIYG